jgi:hypothetical protein
MALPEHPGRARSRAVPVDFHHCPTAKKPGKLAAESNWQQYREQQRILNLSKQGSERLKHLRTHLDQQGEKEKLLQAYLWRWEIEVDSREEKSILGLGQAQVRNPNSAQSVPAFNSAIYAMLHLATHRALKTNPEQILPRPKWYRKKEHARHSTGDLVNNLKAQAWTKFIGINFSGFVNSKLKSRSLRNVANPTTSAMFYLRN